MPPRPCPPGSTLPNELWSMVFDYLRLDDVVRLGRVCSQWLIVAHGHPTFWRDLNVWGPTAQGLASFTARLSSTSHVGVDISVRLTDFEGPAHAGARKTILDAIATNLSRTACLCLTFEQEFAEEVFSSLRNPAPVLDWLSLVCSPVEATPEPCVPHDLLAGSVPPLAHVAIFGLVLPPQPVGAFARAKRFHHAISKEPSMLTNLFGHFPALKVFAVCISNERDVEEIIAQFERAPELDSLEFQVEMEDLHTLFAACPRLLSIPTIEFIDHEATLYLLALRLPGPLCLSFRVSSEIELTVTSLSRGWRRTCTIYASDKPRRAYVPGPDFYACAAIVHRITTLALLVHSAEYHIAPLVGELPACDTLEISFGRFFREPAERDPYTPRMARIPLPALAKVVLQPEAGVPRMAFPAKTLAWFLDDLVGRRTPRLPLDLNRISLEGDRAPLEADYIFPADVLL